jgi:hypothetical protein
MPDEYEDMGTQFDGEPSAVVTEEPEQKTEPTEEPEAEAAKEEPTEETPEQIEERKKKTGSQREREKRLRAEERSRQLEERLAVLERGKAPEAQKPAIEPDAPKIEDFDTHAEWTQALARHEAKKLREEERAQEAIQAAKSEWEKKVEAGREKFDDFDDVIEASAGPSPLLAQRLYKPSTPVEVVYHLASNPKELAEINRMRDPGDVAEALAEIKSRLTKPAPPALKRETKAPPPITPLAPSGLAPSVALHPGFEEF